MTKKVISIPSLVGAKHSNIILDDGRNPHGTLASDVGAEPANVNIQQHIADGDLHNSLFIVIANDHSALPQRRYNIVGGTVETSLSATEGVWHEFLYTSGTWTFDWETSPPANIPDIIAGHLYRFTYTNSTWYMIDITKPDLNRISQDVTDMGLISGALNLDVSTSFVRTELNGNITSLTFSEAPTGTTFVWLVRQSSAYTIEFAGSGVYTKEGTVNADLQPATGAGAVTEYYLTRHANLWTINKVNYESTPL